MLGWRDVPIEPDVPRRAGPRRSMPRLPAAVRRRPAGDRGHRPRPARVRRCASASSTSCRRRGSDVLPVAVGAHPRLQGHAHHAAARGVLPRPARRARSSRRWPWCTAASRRTRSRRGRWPTRTASSPTTARSTPCRATATGCAPARRCSSTRPAPGRPRARLPDLHARARRDTASFDEVLELLHLGGRTAAARRADDDPGGVGEPRARWTRPSGPSTASTRR